MAKVKVSAMDSCVLEVPFGPPREGYESRRIDIPHLDLAQTKALAGIVSALDKSQAVLFNGRRVVNNNDAIRWVLEQIAKTQNIANGPNGANGANGLNV